MRPNLELLAALLIHVRPLEDRVAVDPRRQRHRPGGFGSSADDGLDDLVCRLVQELVIVRFKADANALSHGFSRLATGSRQLPHRALDLGTGGPPSKGAPFYRWAADIVNAFTQRPFTFCPSRPAGSL